jgi:hypothetical protein
MRRLFARLHEQPQKVSIDETIRHIIHIKNMRFNQEDFVIVLLSITLLIFLFL